MALSSVSSILADVAPDPGSTGDGSVVPVIVAIVVIVVVLVAIGLARRRRRDRTAD